MSRILKVFSLPDVAFRRVLQTSTPLEIIELFLTASNEGKDKILMNKCHLANLTFTGRNFELDWPENKKFYLEFTGNCDMENGKERVINGATFQFWTKTADSIICIPPNFDESLLAIFNLLARIFKVKNLTYCIKNSTSEFIDFFLRNAAGKCNVFIENYFESSEDIIKMIESSEIRRSLQCSKSSFSVNFNGMVYEEEEIMDRFTDDVTKIMSLGPENLVIEVDEFDMKLVDIVVEIWMENEAIKHMKSLRIKTPSGIEEDSVDSDILTKFDAQELRDLDEVFELFDEGEIQKLHEIQRTDGTIAIMGFIESNFLLYVV